MKKYIFAFLTIAILSIFLVPSHADSPALSQANSESELAALLVEADQVYAQRSDDAKAKEALDLYEKLATANPTSVEARWKASRASWWVADHSSVKKDKIELFQHGLDWAKQAIALNDKSPDAHFWLGANMGSFGEVKGVLKSLSLVRPIRQEMNKVLALDPTYQGGAGFRVLGVVDFKVPGFAGGSRKRSFENLSKALQMSPENPFNLYYIAEFYETGGEKDKAKTYLKMLADLKASTDDLKADVEMMQKKGEALQKKI